MLFLGEFNYKQMKYKTLFLLLLMGMAVSAQKIELRWSDEIKTKENVYLLGGKNGNYFTRFKNNDDQMIIRKFDKQLKLIEEKPLEFDFDNKKRIYGGTYFLKDQIIHFIEESVRKEDKMILYCATTDFNMVPTGKIIILDEAADDAIDFGRTGISPDSTKVLVYHEVKGRKKDPSKLNFKVYNATFTEVLLERSVALNVKTSKFDMQTVQVDNLGNVFVLAKIYKEKDEREKDQSVFSYKVFAFDKKGSDKEFDFDYPNRDIESIDIIPGKNNTLVCTGFLKILNKGFFGKGKKTLISDELFSSVIDCQTLSIASAKKFDLEGLYPEKMNSSSDYVPYKVRDIFYKKDGGISIIAEQYKLVIVTSSSPNGGTRTTYRYYYCDIACIQVNSKSEVESVSKVAKYQLNARNPSIVATFFEGKTYVVYEDEAKNLAVVEDKKIKRSSGSSDKKNALFLVTFEPSGEFTKDIIYNYKESKIHPYVTGSRLGSPGEIILSATNHIGVLKVNK